MSSWLPLFPGDLGGLRDHVTTFSSKLSISNANLIESMTRLLCPIKTKVAGFFPYIVQHEEDGVVAKSLRRY